MTKSHVGMLHNLCPVCHHIESSDLLLDTHLEQSLEKDNYRVGSTLCVECKKMASEDRIAIIGLLNDPGLESGDLVKASNQNRSGRILWIRRYAWPHIFNVPAPDGDAVCVPDNLIDFLQDLVCS